MTLIHIINPSPIWANEAIRVMKCLGPGEAVVRIAKTHPHHTDTAVEWALNEGVSCLIIWGGDGTINRVVRALLQRKAINRVSLGIVPVGTCNDIARFLGLSPGDIKKALDVVKDGRETAWSVGLVNGIPFLNSAGFGRRFDTGQSYSKKNAITSLWRMHPLHLEASWQGGKVTGQYLMGLICNAPYFSGGLHFSKSVSPFDRELDVFLVKEIPKPKLIFRLGLGRMGIPLQNKNVTNFRTSGLNIRFSEEIWPQTDGEPPSSPTSKVTFGIYEEPLRLLVPKTLKTFFVFIAPIGFVASLIFL